MQNLTYWGLYLWLRQLICKTLVPHKITTLVIAYFWPSSPLITLPYLLNILFPCDVKGITNNLNALKLIFLILDFFFYLIGQIKMENTFRSVKNNFHNITFPLEITTVLDYEVGK